MRLSPNPGADAPPWVHAELGRLAQDGLLRQPMAVLSREPGRIHLPSGTVLDFTSNDYLGLSHHPSCLEAAGRALRDHGCGSGSSRIVTGHSTLQAQLEVAVSEWLCTDAAVLFASGYQANVGVLSALAQPGDLIFSDAHNHASLVDGCRLGRATVQIYPHLDAVALEAALSCAPVDKRKLVVTDSLFSMDGESAPLVALAEACRRYGALLVVDEAHALGVLGPGGAGLSAALGVEPSLRMGTFSKALGSHGAFVAGSISWIQYLWNRARPLIYSTALPPPSLGASLAAISVLRTKEGDSLRQGLLDRSAEVRTRLQRAAARPTGAGSPLVGLCFDEPGLALGLQWSLLADGILTWAFRPPTVPSGTSKLRVSLCAAHCESDTDRLTRAIVGALGLKEEPETLRDLA